MNTIDHPDPGGKSKAAMTPAELAPGLKSFASVIERRTAAPLDYAAGERQLHAARVSGDPAQIRSAEDRFGIVADLDTWARADSAGVGMLLLRDAIIAYPGAVSVAVYGLPPGQDLLRHVAELRAENAELRAGIAGIKDAVRDLQDALAGSAVLA